MCGIVGYTGKESVTDQLLNSLELLEYRGYDSAGIALCMEDSQIRVVKKAGKVKNLEEYYRQQISGTSHSFPAFPP